MTLRVFALFAFVALLVGYFYANLDDHAGGATSFLFIGLMLYFLGVVLGPTIDASATDRRGRLR